MQSTTHELGLHLVDGGDDAAAATSRQQPQLGSHGARGARRGARTCWALSSARDVERSARPPREQLQQQRALADAGLAAEQRDRAGHEPAAEHPVELADAGGCRAARLCASMSPIGVATPRGDERHAAASEATSSGGLSTSSTRCSTLRRRGSARPTSDGWHRIRCNDGRAAASTCAARYATGVTELWTARRADAEPQCRDVPLRAEGSLDRRREPLAHLRAQLLDVNRFGCGRGAPPARARASASPPGGGDGRRQVRRSSPPGIDGRDGHARCMDRGGGHAACRITSGWVEIGRCA